MKICVFGAGAIGAYLGGLLTKAGFDVVLVARGDHLRAMQDKGLTLVTGKTHETIRVHCVERAEDLGVQDCVVLTLKSHSVSPAVQGMVPLLGSETAVVTAQNGIPWWYFYRHGGSWESHQIQSVDPGGLIWKTIGPARAIGCVVYPSCEITEPGVVQHLDGNRFMLGEPDGSRSERIVALSKAFSVAGLKAPVRTSIRDDIWLKLWGNLSFNPVSVLTNATLEEMAEDSGVRLVIRAMMTEASNVASRLGVSFPVDIDTRIGWAQDVGAHKTSMLQDLERGRPLEIDALVGSVSELGRLVGIETPVIDTVLALARLRSSKGN